jgi:hypothetical protein
MDEIIKNLVLELKASSGAIMIVDYKNKVLTCGAYYNMPDVWVQLINPLEHSTDKNTNGRVALTGVAEVHNGTNVDFHGHLIASYVVVPIKKNEKVVGNIEIISDDPNFIFTDKDMATLEKAAAKELAPLI